MDRSGQGGTAGAHTGARQGKHTTPTQDKQVFNGYNLVCARGCIFHDAVWSCSAITEAVFDVEKILAT